MTRRCILALALAACSPSGGTAVRLEVSYDDAWSLTTFEVAASNRAERANAAHEVRLLIPDEWTGRPVTVAITGLQGQARWAWGSVDVTPVKGEEVRGRVTLARLPCGAWCTAGSTACQGDATVVCEQRDADDCMEWSEPTACGGSTTCSLGTCLAACVDECASGEARCDGPGGLRRCGQADADSCRDWLPAEACPTGQACSNGACGGTCQHECDTGTTICLAAGTSTCGDLDHDGCREWGPIAVCPSGQTCSDGACKTGCTAECTASECTGLLHRTCGQFDLDPCKELSPGTSCVPADPCKEGSCSATAGCASAPLVCEEPPPDECVDSNTLRVYNAAGTCQAPGGCSYSYADQSCPGCPSCDSCAGVTCDMPPPAECVSTSTLRTYATTGTCSAGSCSYPHTDASCAGGCSGGACASGCAPTGWTLSVVDGGGGSTISGTSIALDAQLGVHIAYGAGGLYYAHRPAGGAWSFGKVVDGGLYPTLAVDGTGGLHVAHIAWSGCCDPYVAYGYRPVGGAWSTEFLEPAGDANPNPSLDVDAQGRVHLVFQYETPSITEYLNYMVRDPGGAWSSPTTIADRGWYPSLRVDSAGALHVSFASDNSGAVGYLRRPSGGTWAQADLDASSYPKWTSLAVDGTGRVHVAYKGSSALKYATRSPGGSWTGSTLDSSIGSPSGDDSTGIAVDPEGGVHVAYYDESETALRYAYKPAGGTWQTTAIDSAGDVGTTPSLAVDAKGGVHVAYVDETNGRLKYAYSCP